MFAATRLVPFLFTFLFVLAAAGTGPVLAGAPSSFQLGARAYARGQYQTALAHFNKALRANQYNANLHYYKANALVKLGRHDEAINEYRTSYALDPYGDAAYYCQAALSAYGEPSVGAPLLVVGQGPGAPLDVERAMRKISDQSRQASTKLLDAGQAEKDHHLRLGEIASTRIAEQASLDIANVRPAVLFGVGGFGSRIVNGQRVVFPQLVPFTAFGPAQQAQIESIKQRSAAAQAAARQTASIQAQRAAERFNQRAQALEET
ncbi:MAG TPA: tetratricopeptide repeat protein, partial [Candidatus Obscuribacterales bacterium]